MYLSRALLVRVGHHHARMDPLELSFADRDGTPVHTGVLLRNGGGKTTMLSFVFAVLDPHPNKFISTKRDASYRMADYLRDGEVGHVILEWAVPTGQVTVNGTEEYIRKVTGLVLTRNGTGTPHRRVYGFRSTDQLSFDTLRHGAADRTHLSAEAYIDDLRSRRDPAANLYLDTSTQLQWHRWLKDEQIDPDLIAMQVVMNSQESGAATLLTHVTDAWSFTRKIVELVGRDDDAAALEALKQLHRNHQAAAGKRQELAALQALLDPLAGTTVAADDHATAAADHRQAVARLRTVAGQVAAAARLRAGQVDQLTGQVEQAQAAQTTAETAVRRWQRASQWATHMHATLTLEAAARRVTATETAAAEAREVAAAWAVVGRVVELRAARTDLRDVEGLIAAANDQVGAMQRQLDRRVADTAWQLTMILNRQQEDAQVAAGQADAAEAQARTVTEQLTGATADLGRAEQTQRHHEEELERLAAELARRVAAGDLPDDDVVAFTDTTRTSSAAAKAAATAATGQAKQARADLDQVAQDQTAQRDVVASAGQALATIDATVAALQARLAAIVALPAAAHVVTDPDLLHTDLPAITRQASDRLGRIEETATTAADTLARIEQQLEALANGVPVDPDVATLTRRLTDAYVNAVPGWEWVSKAVPADRREAFVAAHPDLANGVVAPHADPARVAAAVDQVEVDRAIVIGPAPDTDPTADTDTGRTVVLPAAHRYDPDRADQLRGDLTAALPAARIDAEGAAADLRDARRFHDALLAIADVPAQLDSLHRQRTGPQARHDTATAALADLEDRRAGIIERLEQAEGAATRAQSDHDAAQTVLAWAGPLADRAAAVPDVTAAIQEATSRQATLRATITDLTSRLESLQDTAIKARETATTATAERRNTLDLAALHEVDLDRAQPPADPTGLPALEAQFSRIAELRRQVAEARPAEDLVSRQQDLTRRIAELQGQVGAGPAATRAAALADTAQARTPSARQHAHQAAEQAMSAADVAVGQAQAALDRAKAALADIAGDRGREPRPEDHIPTPTTVAEADQVVADVRGRLTTANQTLTAAERHVNTVTRHRNDADQARAALAGVAARAGQLLPILDPDRPDIPDGTGHRPFEGDADQADAATSAATGRAQDTHGRHGQTEKVLMAAQAALTEALAADGLEPQLVETVRSCIHGGSEKLWRAHEAVETRIDTLQRSLESLAADRAHIAESMAVKARELLGQLSRLERLSTMPDGLGDWSGKAFLTVRYRRDATAELAAHADIVIGRLLHADTAPGRMDAVLTDILTSALGRDGLRIAMLKPNAELLADRQRLEALKTSDGERLTAAILLYCILARLRSEETGAIRTGGAGMLWLDNPFGKANDTTLVGLQRTMADRLGVQLVYSTGHNSDDVMAMMHQWNALGRYTERRSGAVHVRPSDQPQVSVRGAHVTRTVDQRAVMDQVVALGGGAGDTVRRPELVTTPHGDHAPS